MKHASNKRIRALLDAISCSMFPNWHIKFVEGKQAVQGEIITVAPYLQIECRNATGTEWTGRKWQLSWQMCDTEVVNTAYLAYQQAMQHELGEFFKFEGVAVYDPHRSIRDATQQDVRLNSIVAA